MKNISFFHLVIIIMTSNLVIGQSFTNVNVNHIKSGDQNTDGGNSIALHGNNVYLLWQDMEGTFFSYVSKSTDGGETFSDGVKVGGNNPHVFGSIDVDNSGTLYVAWNGIIDEMPGGVYFAKSTDEAATFSSPLTISEEGIFPKISVYGSNVYIFYCKSKVENKVGFFFVRSIDGGISFEEPYEITDAVFEDIKFDSPLSMSVDNNGNIYCVWNDGRRNGLGTDIYFAKSTNSGVSFGSNIMVNDILGNSDYIRTGCVADVDGANVYVIWRQTDDDEGNNRKILFSKSLNGGSTFEEEIEIIAGGSGSPSLTVNSAGEIYLLYPQYTGQQNGMFCAKSNDQGDTFPVTVFINSINAHGKNPSIVVDGNDNFYASWTDDRSGEGNDDVFFAKGTITITGIDEAADLVPAQFELKQNYPNPFNPTTIISYSLPVAGNVSLKIFDILGREVFSFIDEEKAIGNYEMKFDGSNLTSGVYFYRLQAGSFSETKKFVLIK